MRAWVGVAVLLGSVGLTGCPDKGVAKADPGKGDAGGKGKSKAKPGPGARDGGKAAGDGAAAKSDEGGAADSDKVRVWSFDDAPPGGVPRDLGPSETNGAGTPAKWSVVARADAPTPPHVFGISETKNSGQTYNLALVSGVSVADVDLSVMVHADTGEEDQGGGVVFRAKDPSNYYIARWNPLEDNVRFYVVLGDLRTAIGKTEIELERTEWHTLRVVAEGPAMQLFMDDEPVLRVEDSQITSAGTVGLWTKADAATWFDDLTLSPP